jgi:hypothetical protein
MTNLRNGKRYERVAIVWIRPSPRHARIHPPRQLRKIKKHLEKFGQVTPLVVTPDGEIIDGHAIWQVLKSAGHEHVDVLIVADQPPEAIKALRLSLNRLPEETLWDKGKLRKEIGDLIDIGFDIELTGFDPPEIDFLFESEAPRDNLVEDADAIPPLPKIPVAQPGDIYFAGNHRIGCGSGLDLDVIHRVRGDRMAAVSIFDPPFGSPKNFSARGKCKDSSWAQGAGKLSSAELCKTYQRAMEVLRACSASRSLIYAFADWRHSLEMTAAAQLNALPMLSTCVWIKAIAGAGSLYRNQHQFVHVFKAGDEAHVSNVHLGRYGRSRSDVWHYAGVNSLGGNRDKSPALYHAAKPVQLLNDAIRDVTKRRDAVFDTFLGSGSTLIAAEETGRFCIGVELDPRCVDVTILRWQRATGREAILTETGETFNERARRLARQPRRVGHD